MPDDVLYFSVLPPGDLNRGRHLLFTAVTDPVTLDQWQSPDRVVKDSGVRAGTFE